MLHLMPLKARDEVGVGQAVPQEKATGDIAVFIDGNSLDSELVSLAGLLARQKRCRVHLIHIIKVPRSLPLKAILYEEHAKAEKVLAEALNLADKVGCNAVTEVVQAREIGPSIVDEAKDHHCKQLILGDVHDTRHKGSNQIGRTVPYVLAHAPCRVWIVRDPLAA